MCGAVLSLSGSATPWSALTWLCRAAEVVLFTAGLEDYAKPICDELDGRYGGAFHARLYRPATTACAAYPCLKVRIVRLLMPVTSYLHCTYAWCW